MGTQKTLAARKAAPKRKTDNQLLAEAVKTLEKVSIQIQQLGVPLRDAYKLTNLMPNFHLDIFRPSEGYFAHPSLRSAYRSACWRMKVQDGVADEHSCYVHLLLGPYKDEPTKREKIYKAWLTDLFIMPFNFRPMGEEIGEGDTHYIVYQTTLPVPRAVVEQTIQLLAVPKQVLTEERENEAFDLLEPHYSK